MQGHLEQILFNKLKNVDKECRPNSNVDVSQERRQETSSKSVVKMSSHTYSYFLVPIRQFIKPLFSLSVTLRHDKLACLYLESFFNSNICG